jgi:hypothetical protein
MGLLSQEAAEVDSGEGDGGEIDGDGEALVEQVDCGEDVPCGMVPNERDLPCSAIDGGTCVEGCCEPGDCRGPNEDFFMAIGHEGCPPHGQGEVDEGCCIRGKSADAPGHFCPDGPKCRDDHPSGLHLPCVAINGGECVEGCCDPGPCKGPSEDFFIGIGLGGCPQGAADLDGCCILGGGGDDGGDGIVDGGGTADSGDGIDDGGTTDGGGTI